ncbi:isoprenyl transferase [Feifania hominis]|uniref:Isoprenyl transferase n=1 Tax=Feifania hominis TaxID=2763660 RepID=A0A926DCM2_9FIRM|nr:isoprenyl transferase [Feifania hominis]MBC8535648.1 isoprenyl transferase [Feifania hominis]
MLFGRKRQNDELDWNNLPEHIGIIMDGNGRWAKRRGLPRTAGHRVGAETFRKIARHAQSIGIGYLTVYAFSTENWKRPPEEIETIMNLLHDYLLEARESLGRENIVLRCIGDPGRLREDLQQMIREISAMSESNTGLIVNIALNYGGQDEIVHAVNAALAKRAQAGLPAQLTKQEIEDNLYTAGQPMPDLIIRPSGEMRLSNFLTWQSAYSEFYVTEKLWPDFNEQDLERAIAAYQKRNRRFGGV